MLYFLLGFLVGGLIFYFVGRRNALIELGDKITADIKREDAIEHRRMAERYGREDWDK